MADDIKILQRMISKLEDYSDLWNMQINLEKSKIMVFRKVGRIPRDQTTLNGADIEVVNKYTYLGVIFTLTMSFTTEHLRIREQMVKSNINMCWKN